MGALFRARFGGYGMAKILNIGSLNLDYVYQVAHFVRPGETISSIDRQTFCGGKGLNQTIALARAGADIWHAGAIGKQDGAPLLQTLTQDGVHTEFLKEIDGISSGHAIIQVDESGQNCILLYGGTNQQISQEQILQALSAFSEGDFLILQNEINNMPFIIENASKKGLQIVLNPSPMDEKILRLPLNLVDYFILNEIEAQELSGAKTADHLLDDMIKAYPKAKIVLTLGENGSQYYCDGKILKQAAHRVHAVDTTAAGDTFTGYFFAGLARGESAEESLQMASLASAIAVSRAGASPSIPKREEVLTALQKL